MKQLTENQLKQIKYGSGPRILWEGGGFGVKVYPNRKTYVVAFRVNGKKRLTTIADVGEIPLKVARVRALMLKAEKADINNRNRDRIQEIPVSDGINRFLQHCEQRIELGTLKRRTLIEYQRQLYRHIDPDLGDLSINEVTKRDVERMLARVKGRVLFNRVLTLVKLIFNRFIDWGYREIGNPARGISKAREEPRDRVLTESELSRLWEGLEQLRRHHTATADVLRCLMLSGLRISEVVAIRWKDVDWENATATLPTTKTGRRIHRMPRPALDIMNQRPRMNDYVFTNGGNALSCIAPFITTSRQSLRSWA